MFILLGKKSGTVSPTSPVTQTEAERVIAEERRRLDEFAKKVFFSFFSNLVSFYMYIFVLCNFNSKQKSVEKG